MTLPEVCRAIMDRPGRRNLPCSLLRQPFDSLLPPTELRQTEHRSGKTAPLHHKKKRHTSVSVRCAGCLRAIDLSPGKDCRELEEQAVYLAMQISLRSRHRHILRCAYHRTGGQVHHCNGIPPDEASLSLVKSHNYRRHLLPRKAISVRRSPL